MKFESRAQDILGGPATGEDKIDLEKVTESAQAFADALGIHISMVEIDPSGQPYYPYWEGFQPSDFVMLDKMS